MSVASHAGGRLTVDLDALAWNWQQLSALAQPGECGAAVKANGYGLGLDPVSRTLWTAGCRSFFVALPEEAFSVRAILPDANIYCLGGLTPGGADDYRAQKIKPVLNSLSEVRQWCEATQFAPAALHVDTGMNRLGLRMDEALALSKDKNRTSALNLSLLMSHLACADTPEHPLNGQQAERFRELKEWFPGVPASLANSAGTLLGGAYRHDLARPGIALYGGASAPVTPNPIRPVVTLEARIIQIRKADAHEAVGYGAAETLGQAARLAILGVGYADGYHRLAGSSDDRKGAHVSFGGKRAPLVGRISMDLMAVDITGPDFDHLSAGDYATLIGTEIGVDDPARHAQTIGYEFLTGLGHRLERRYIGGSRAAQ
ncbi:MAG: alanine racemase [Pseudomonadota bacterium]